MPLNVKSQGTKKFEVFSQWTDDSENLSCETQYIASYEYVNMASFAVSDKKLWLEEVGYLHTYRSPFIFIQTHSIEGSKLIHSVEFFLPELYIQHRTAENFFIFMISNNESLIFQILKAVGPLGGNFLFFWSLGI